MEVPQQPKSKKPKGKRSAKKNALRDRQTGKKEKYAYTINDVLFGEFKVLNTANAWWLDRKKVENLIDIYKMDGTNAEACAYAGIYEANLKYFQKLHPDFLSVKHGCRQLPVLTARKCVFVSLSTNEVMAMKYLEKKAELEFGYNVGRLPESPDDPEVPTGNTISFVDFEEKKEVIKEPDVAESK